jgi:hypothetical protein
MERTRWAPSQLLTTSPLQACQFGKIMFADLIKAAGRILVENPQRGWGRFWRGLLSGSSGLGAVCQSFQPIARRRNAIPSAANCAISALVLP